MFLKAQNDSLGFTKEFFVKLLFLKDGLLGNFNRKFVEFHSGKIINFVSAIKITK
jgi:hypothetical protein